MSSINDHKEYITVTKALAVLGFSAAEVKVYTATAILCVFSSTLHIVSSTVHI